MMISVEHQRPADAMAALAAELRERARRVLGQELERSLRRKLRHLPEEDRAAVRTMIEAAADNLLQGPAARLRALEGQSELAARRGAAVRELFGLGQA